MADIDEGLAIVAPMTDEVGNRETFGYENFVAFRRGTVNVHLIVSDAAPTAVTTFDSAPRGSLCLNVAGGNDTTLFVKEATGATGWAPVTTGAAA